MSLNIENTISERLDCFDYLNKCITGRLYYHNIVRLTPRDFTSSSDPVTLSKRTTQWLSLGLSISKCMKNPFPVAVARLCILFDEYQAHYIGKGLFKILGVQQDTSENSQSLTSTTKTPKGIEGIIPKKKAYEAIPLSYYDITATLLSILTSLYSNFLLNQHMLNESQFSKIDSSINTHFISKILSEMTEVSRQTIQNEIEALETEIVASTTIPQKKTLLSTNK